MSRICTALVGWWWLGVVGAALDTPPDTSTLFDRLRDRARELVKEEYRAGAKLPEYLEKLDYDAYQDIRFRRDEGLWHSEPGRFEVQFFHPGFLYREPVRIHVVEDARARELTYSANLFDYGKNRFPEPLPPELGFAGLRLLYPLHDPAKMDEVAVFLGVSYFRIIGAHQVFGASARGLAIDTAERSGEEFPRFSEFWIEKPGELADHIRVFALLESRRSTGAYQFVIAPGDQTHVEVEASLFLREKVGKIGLAPLTSMFVFGENRTRYFPDFRPEVHDSDGLLIATERGEWLWRPLANPSKLHRVTAFPLSNPAGFGLLQRDRSFDHYQDLEASYERRPSLWVTLPDEWGKGRIELVEIPTSSEAHDNIVAYWVPEQELEVGEEIRFAYRLHAYATDPERPPASLLRVQSTRIHPGISKGRSRFVIDFAGPAAARLLDPADEVSARLEVSPGQHENLVVQRNRATGGWRVFFDVIQEGDKAPELRLLLQRADQVLSEIWTYSPQANR